jgi:hypothetical protein
MPMPILFEKGCAYYLDALSTLTKQPLNVSSRYWDRIFYDVGSLSRGDENTLFADKRGGILSPFAYGEGEILVVPPSGAGREIRYYKQTQQFLDKESQDIRAIVVAGVGSSVYGTAALARNVADTYKFDVAGIVAGYGGLNLQTEALGGYFLLGLQERAGLQSTKLVSPTADVKTLVDILLADPPQLEHLVGHSKGSLLIDFALEQFVEEHQDVPDPPRYDPLIERLNIVTLGAVVSPHERFNKNVRQFMGQLDHLGWLNSHLGILYEEVPGAGHQLNPNPAMPLRGEAVDVSKVLPSKPGAFPEKKVSQWFGAPDALSEGVRRLTQTAAPSRPAP